MGTLEENCKNQYFRKEISNSENILDRFGTFDK